MSIARASRRLLTLTLMLIACSLALAACGGGGAGATDTGAADGRLPVVATFSILGDLVRNVGGDRIALTTLVGPDGDAHTFEPTPQDGVRLARARVVFENGLGFEPWLDDLYRSADADGTRVVASRGVRPRELDGEEDPHAWQDVRNAELMVRNVRDGLIAADPAGAAVYRANAARYLRELERVDRFVAGQIAAIPPERRRLVTDHDAFGYFSARYGIPVVGSVLGSVSTEAGDPSAGQVADLARRIRATGVPAIFAENIANPDAARALAAAAGVRFGPPLYSDALGPVGSPAATYLGLMRHNARALHDSLAG